MKKYKRDKYSIMTPSRWERLLQRFIVWYCQRKVKGK